MRPDQLAFRPGLGPTIAMLIAVPLFGALGLWQVNRTDAKRQLADELAARWERPARPLPDVPDWEALRYTRAVVRGRYVAARQFVVGDRIHGGRRGVHVITPLLTEEGRMLLVNRGWAKDAVAATAPPAGLQEVSGRIVIPEPPALILGPAAPAQPWRQAWSRLDPAAYAALGDADVAPAALLLDPEAAGGFQRAWPQPKTNVAMHIGYAIQWFAFAALALGIWLYRSLRRPESAQ